MTNPVRTVKLSKTHEVRARKGLFKSEKRSVEPWINGYNVVRDENKVRASVGCMLMGEHGGSRNWHPTPSR